MGGKGSGRKRKSKGRADNQRSLTNMLPKAIEVIGQTMDGGNKDRLRYEAAVETKNSVLGKPKVSTEIDLRGGLQLTAIERVELFQILVQKKKELELMGEGNATKQGANEGTEEGR